MRADRKTYGLRPRLWLLLKANAKFTLQIIHKYKSIAKNSNALKSGCLDLGGQMVKHLRWFAGKFDPVLNLTPLGVDDWHFVLKSGHVIYLTSRAIIADNPTSPVSEKLSKSVSPRGSDRGDSLTEMK